MLKKKWGGGEVSDAADSIASFQEKEKQHQGLSIVVVVVVFIYFE